MTAPSIVTSRHCPLVGAGAKMTWPGFVRCCKAKQATIPDANSRVYGQRVGQIIHFCSNCKIGSAVTAGEKIKPPKGITILDSISSLKKEKTMLDIRTLGNWDLSKMPDKIVKLLSPADLRMEWKTPVIPSAQKGTCPNCRRHDMTQSSFGLCGSCKNVAQNKKGFEMLIALVDKAKHLNPDNWEVEKTTRSPSEEVPEPVPPASIEEVPEPVPPASTEKLVETVHDVTDYIELAKQIGKIVQEKQEAYGDSFGKSGQVMRILYPDGILPKQYDDALCVVRIVDKLFRIATDRDALGESPYVDISGYGLLGTRRVKNQTRHTGQMTHEK